MDLGYRRLHGLADLDVRLAGERRVDPALEADLDAPALPRLLGAAGDLLDRHQIRLAAQVFGELPFRERAEAAAEVADVGVVDVAGDDVGDLVSADLAPEPVGGREHTVGVLPARGEEPHDLVLAELLTGVDRERVPRDERDRCLVTRGPAVFSGEPVAVGPTQSGREHRWIDPFPTQVLRVHSEPRGELEP